MRKLSLYVHIPFCQRKCHYCDFLSAPASGGEQKEYVKALCHEIRSEGKEYKGALIDTIFFGGGTPSLLTGVELGEIMTTLRENFAVEKDAEITLEVNPGTVDWERLKAWQRHGINRLSVGLQSAANEELKELGRIHTWEEFLTTWKSIRDCGFSNVNIDLMSALPGQTLTSYENTLRRVLELRPEHISAYSLMIEEDTPFYRRFGRGGDEEYRLPSEEEDRRMYERTKELLGEAGYERYEISNYSIPGYECGHNTGYWTGKEYLGLGLGASSYTGDMRFSRESKLEVYICKILSGESTVVWQQRLDLQERMEEFMFLGLRMMRGVSPKRFKELFGIALEERYEKQLIKLKEMGLLEETREGRLALTERGIDVSNQVFVEFL